MTEDRQHLKCWLHSMRAEVEAHAGISDPFAPLEAEEDLDINAFQRIEADGPPCKSYSNPEVRLPYPITPSGGLEFLTPILRLQTCVDITRTGYVGKEWSGRRKIKSS